MQNNLKSTKNTGTRKGKPEQSDEASQMEKTGDRKRKRERSTIAPTIEFQPGDWVRVTGGKFAGGIGRVVALEPKQKAKLRLHAPGDPRHKKKIRASYRDLKTEEHPRKQNLVLRSDQEPRSREDESKTNSTSPSMKSGIFV